MIRRLPDMHCVDDIRLGDDVFFDAWWYTFLAENNMEHGINPLDVAGAEQLRFMVALDEEQVYVPCSDALFRHLTATYRAGTMAGALRKAYAGAWRLTVAMVGQLGLEPAQRRRVLLFCRHRLRGSLAVGNMLPSRLLKRLVTTVLSLNGHEDPWEGVKQAQNAAMSAFLSSDLWLRTVHHIPPALAATVGPCANMPALRYALNMAELARLFFLAAHGVAGLPPVCPSTESFCTAADALIPGLEQLLGGMDAPPRTLLFVVDSEGGIVADIALLRALSRQGHRIVLALKDGPLFEAATFWDEERDPVLTEHLRGLHHIAERHVSKNALLRELAGHHFVVINDGTSELLNLYRTSLTFARAWKECDGVIIKGRRQAEQVLGSSSSFTRDVLCFWRQSGPDTMQSARPEKLAAAERGCGSVHVRFRSRSPHVRRFGEVDLMAQADAIIDTMRAARAEGRAVMFYSCIVGSLPGQLDTAIALATTFVRHLRDKLDQALIINPAEHFQPGMDADDLMFMWERVQRSGFINTWRFQTVDDIETSFALMDRKVPAVWAGKDATYSTGCTKEMHIALDMQHSHPEMQILGPSIDKFLRRGEYGVGKFHDSTLVYV